MKYGNGAVRITEDRTGVVKLTVLQMIKMTFYLGEILDRSATERYNRWIPDHRSSLVEGIVCRARKIGFLNR